MWGIMSSPRVCAGRPARSEGGDPQGSAAPFGGALPAVPADVVAHALPPSAGGRWPPAGRPARPRAAAARWPWPAPARSARRWSAPRARWPARGCCAPTDHIPRGTPPAVGDCAGPHRPALVEGPAPGRPGPPSSAAVSAAAPGARRGVDSCLLLGRGNQGLQLIEAVLQADRLVDALLQEVANGRQAPQRLVGLGVAALDIGPYGDQVTALLVAGIPLLDLQRSLEVVSGYDGGHGTADGGLDVDCRVMSLVRQGPGQNHVAIEDGPRRIGHRVLEVIPLGPGGRFR